MEVGMHACMHVCMYTRFNINTISVNVVHGDPQSLGPEKL